MRAAPQRPLAVLAREACLDAARRRIVPLVVAVSLLSLLLVDSCTSCAPTLRIGGQPVEASQIAGWSGALIFLVLSLWTLVLAGVLAGGHLAESLDDGSAALVLARPVSRRVFVLARLVGALSVTGAAGALLLGGAASLLHLRLGVALGPAAWGAAACAAGAVSVAALAALASLFLPQVAAVVLVLFGVSGIAFANLLTQFAGTPGGWLSAIDRIGPPLATSVVLALAPWLDAAPPPGAALALSVRLGIWAAGSVAILVLVFEREELR